jgi:DNA-binding PadR family transcriptional regulator
MRPFVGTKVLAFSPIAPDQASAATVPQHPRKKWREGDLDDLVKSALRSLIRVHVLYHADKEPVFGTEMLEELREHGYRVGPGTLYPLLHSMHEGRYLTCKSVVVNGKVRKYYRCTARGRAALVEFRARLKELHQELFKG